MMTAARMADRLSRGPLAPEVFRRTLLDVPSDRRDGWVDRVFGIDGLPADGPDLPQGCVPYLPSDVHTLLRMIEAVGVGPDDVFVDIGAGIGRAATLVHCLTGARVVAVEVQSTLAARARDLAARVAPQGVDVFEADARRLAGPMARGTVFFLYCPFSGAQLDPLLADLARIAGGRTIRL